MRLLIVGGGPAALATARAYREAGGNGDVTLLTRELSVPYTRPSLSKEYLRGERDDDDLPIERAEWYARTSVEVRFGAEVETLDPDARTLVLGSGETLHYDACVLATGAVPASLPVPGATEQAGARHQRRAALGVLPLQRLLTRRAVGADPERHEQHRRELRRRRQAEHEPAHPGHREQREAPGQEGRG